MRFKFRFGYGSRGEVRRASGAVAAALYYVVFALLSSYLIHASKNIGFMNQGDFSRAVGFFLGGPIDTVEVMSVKPVGFIWSYLDVMGGPRLAAGSSSLLFWLSASLQKLYSNYFDVFTLALVAKLYLIAMSHFVAARIATSFGFHWIWRTSLCVAFLLVFFAAHNVALLNSFYTEFALFLAFPLMLLAFLNRACDRRSDLLLVLSSWIAGAAKVQFFYVPLLILFAMMASGHGVRRGLTWKLIVGLSVAQLLCLLPLRSSEYTALNYYHSTYLGSYAAMSDGELTDIGINGSDRECVLVDAWGNRLDSLESTTFKPGFRTCFGQRKQTVRDVLEPYVMNPALFAVMWSKAVPAHFSVQYFHVSRFLPYIIPTNGKSFRSGSNLIALSRFRDRLVGPSVMLCVTLLGLMLPMVAKQTGARTPLGAFSIFLSLFCLSQIVICVLGEGVRDLGRHLSAAQYSLDLLLLICSLQILAIWSHRRSIAAFTGDERRT